ncbi:uncharacterized protein LOC128546437 [Mercenaria mercenaria]|uniref:uncharacterized protein LOC128546437 n=1 Tax=Mercenaria mercenaria TaxID=6596 RepID=UPI00234F49EE|nr:uncharacterized protein LOC128546437 [Mercenaria mercenaria]
MAKNRVTPVKQLTIPKLELCAALIGSRLAQHITSTIDCTKVYLWSDSQIVLKWISSSKSQPVFISNRVREIRELTDGFQWQYCPTDSNPADFLSRGVTYDNFLDNRLWMNGPIWLKNDTSFPQGDCKLIVYDSCENESESSNSETAVLTSTQSKLPNPSVLEIIDIQRFSSYRKLLRVTAYVIRFVNNCRNVKKSRGPLESHEINTEARQLIKHVQDIHFHDVKQYLSQKEKRCTTIPNLVRQLDLFLDEDNLIRCGGRISNAPLLDSTKFPYLLPSRNNFTDLIIMDAHITQLHSGT